KFKQSFRVAPTNCCAKSTARSAAIPTATRPRIPDPGRDEVVQLIVFAKPKPLRHRLNALAIARTDQPRHVEWTHLSPRLVTQPIQKRLEKASKLFFPIRRPANHGRPLQKPTTHESQKNWFGNPVPLKICQSSARWTPFRPSVENFAHAKPSSRL